jgi:hypothetical protein
LRQDLANREAELRDLRSNQRDQVKVLQESTQEVTRAKVKLRRLATQADAASYIAEVEVAMESLRSSLGATSTVPLMVLAQAFSNRRLRRSRRATTVWPWTAPHKLNNSLSSPTVRSARQRRRVLGKFSSRWRYR